MIIGDRLRELREKKHLSRGDIEKRTGLLRCYIWRIENGHTIPAVETLEKLARGLEVPIHQLFYNGDKPPEFPEALKFRDDAARLWGNAPKDADLLVKFRRVLSRLGGNDRKLLVMMAREMAEANGAPAKKGKKRTRKQSAK